MRHPAARLVLALGTLVTGCGEGAEPHAYPPPAGAPTCPTDQEAFVEPARPDVQRPPLVAEPTDSQVRVVTRLAAEANAGEGASRYWLTEDEPVLVDVAVSIGRAFAGEVATVRVAALVDGKQVPLEVGGAPGVTHTLEIARSEGAVFRVEPDLGAVEDGAHLLVLLLQVDVLGGGRVVHHAATIEVFARSATYCGAYDFRPTASVPSEPATSSMLYTGERPPSPDDHPPDGIYDWLLTYAPDETESPETRLQFFGLVDGVQVPITGEQAVVSVVVGRMEAAVVELSVPAAVRSGRFSLYATERWGTNVEDAEGRRLPDASRTWRVHDFVIP